MNILNFKLNSIGELHLNNSLKSKNFLSDSSIDEAYNQEQVNPIFQLDKPCELLGT